MTTIDRPPAQDSHSAEPRRILFVEASRFTSYGGSKRFVANVVSAMDRDRWMPHVVFYRFGPYVDELRRMGVWVRSLDDRVEAPGGESVTGDSVPLSGLRTRSRLVGVRRTASGEVVRTGFRRFAWELRCLLRLIYLDARKSRRLDPLLPERVDLIHYNSEMFEHYEWAHLARRLGVPYVLRENGPWRARTAAWRIVARHASSIICLTEERARMIREKSGGRARADVVPNGISTRDFAPRRSREAVRAGLGVPSGAFLIVTAASYLPERGQVLGLEAAAALAGQGIEFLWIFCGATLSGDYRRQVLERAALPALASRVRVLDEVREMADLFAAADLAITTAIEPPAFDNSVLEAMASGTAVLVPNEGANPDILEAGRHGFLYEPRNAASLAGSLRRIIESPETRAAMAHSGRRRVEEEFDLDVQVKKLSAIYERALSEQAAPSHRRRWIGPKDCRSPHAEPPAGRAQGVL